MCKKFALVLIVAVSCLVGGRVWLGAATTVPAHATFRDAASDRIQSDSFIPSPVYEDAFYCVKSGVSGNGFGFRSRTYGCSTTTPRSVTLDFSQPVAGGCTSPTYVNDAYAGGQVDICGTNLVPDVRILAGTLFASSAPSRGTPVMLVFSTPPNYSGPGGFELDFEQNVGVSVVSSTTRQLTASATAIAELYQNVPSGSGNKGRKVSLGRYYMPFSVTVAKVY